MNFTVLFFDCSDATVMHLAAVPTKFTEPAMAYLKIEKSFEKQSGS